jgi:acetyl/propionyl-CoA carboxylase alpha subunit
VEFSSAQSTGLLFIEVNTRLQVEHGLVTTARLVKLQIHVARGGASGEPRLATRSGG